MPRTDATDGRNPITGFARAQSADPRDTPMRGRTWRRWGGWRMRHYVTRRQWGTRQGAGCGLNQMSCRAYQWRSQSHPNVPYPGTGLKGRTDGLTDGLASKHKPSYQQKHRIKILKQCWNIFLSCRSKLSNCQGGIKS